MQCFFNFRFNIILTSTPNLSSDLFPSVSHVISFWLTCARARDSRLNTRLLLDTPRPVDVRGTCQLAGRLSLWGAASCQVAEGAERSLSVACLQLQ
jgi:hypothetical protein